MCVCVGSEQGDVIGGCHKIYVAFTVEQVVKCNYRGVDTPQSRSPAGRLAGRRRDER